MIEQLKYADIIKLGNHFHLVKNVEKRKQDIYELTLKDMDSGRIRTEICDNHVLEKMQIRLCKLNYLYSDNEYHYYVEEETNKPIKYTIPFIGSDFDYINGNKNKTFVQRVKPICCNKFPSNIKKGTIINLSTKTEGASIYYTTDGSEPSTNSIPYIKPILINENVLIKARAYKDGYESSFVANFDFHLQHKEIKIFLSPSRQNNNHGIANSGFTTEYQEMNKICDELEHILKDYNCILYRNCFETFIEDWSEVNHKEDIDCHLAIHSNASSNHSKKGVENWIHDAYSDTYSLASMIYHNIYDIYYDNKNPLTDRGIKYAKGAIAEASPAYFKFGMNIEVAYHDNLEDAKWIINNRKQIAHAIANAIIDYFQLIIRKK